MKTYECSFEIAGPTAMFTRPDTGAAPVSYPAPTFSAVKGMFESILRLKHAEIRPARVEICEPLVYHAYTTNYGGPLRKSAQISEGNSYQLIATVLINVCYKLHAVALSLLDAPSGINHGHAYQEIFQRRLEREQCHYIPCLGWKEFVPSYIGPLRPETRSRDDVNVVIPSMLRSVWDKPSKGKKSPSFCLGPAKIEKGVLRYAQ